MKNLAVKLIRILSLIPFFKSFFKIFYLKALHKLKLHYQDNTDIKDIILTSNIKSKQFVYGQSDLNFLIIVENDCHPKAVLNEFRKFIDGDMLLYLTVNQTYIPILTQAELQTDTVKSFLIRKTSKDILRWKSILSKKEYTFHLRKQDHFAIVHNSIQNLDFFLLKEYQFTTHAQYIKNVYRSVQNLHKFFPESVLPHKNWRKLGIRMQSLPYLAYLQGKKFFELTWMLLSHNELTYPAEKQYQEFPVDSKLLKYLESLLKLEFVKDFTLTPSIIQHDPSAIRGKLFIDIHVNKSISQKSFFTQIEHVIGRIKEFENHRLKLRIRITTDFLYQLQNEYAYYPFPLEGLYRKEKTYSVARYKYDFLIIHDQIILSSIHFLTTQFMRFRSLQQKTDLIGSKFIKSLNLMYKYYLLAEFLKGKEIKFDLTETQIRENLTPQFSELSLGDVVDEEHWKIIKAQLLYLLKEIRDELVRYDASLKILRF